MPRDKRLYMTFPIDFWTHPKVSRLSDAAFRAFVESNGHSRMIESDGHIEAEDAEFMWQPDVLAELLRSHPTRPLMLRNGDEYVLRDYAEHQFTKADRDALTEKKSRAGKASAESRERARVQQVLNTTQQEPTGIEIGIGEEIGEREELKDSSSDADASDPEGDPEAIYTDGVKELCDLLAEKVRANGHTVNTVGKTWWQACERLIRIDGYSLEQIAWMIHWCTADEFWAGNIRSMSKMREKFSQMKAQAMRGKKPSSSKPTPTDRIAAILAIGEQGEVEA